MNTLILTKNAGFIFLLVILLIVLSPIATVAQEKGIVPPCNTKIGPVYDPVTKTTVQKFIDPCDFNALIQLAQNIINFLIKVGAVLAAIAIAWAGWLVLTSGDNAGKRDEAKKVIWKVFWGFVFMLAAWLIVNLVLKAFGYRGEGLNFLRDIIR